MASDSNEERRRSLRCDAEPVKVARRDAHNLHSAGMLKAYFLDVKDATRTVNRFEVRFVLDGEAIQHSKELAASLRHRRFPNKQGLTIEVLDQSGQKIHEEAVYPEDEQRA
jgi:hypothetical protein